MCMRGQPLCCPRFFCFVHYVLRVHSAIGTAISFTQSSCFGGVNEVVCFLPSGASRLVMKVCGLIKGIY